MESEKSKIKASVDSVFGEDSVPGLQMTVLFCPYIGFLVHARGVGENEISCLFLFL